MLVVYCVLLSLHCVTAVMATLKPCSREDCLPSNVRADSTMKCGRCKNIIHLPCIGIFKKTSELLIHTNIKVFCNSCTSATSPPVVEPAGKLDTILFLLDGIKTVVEDTKEAVGSHLAVSTASAALLNDINTSVKSHVIDTQHAKPSFSSVLAGIAAGNQLNPSSPSRHTPKRHKAGHAPSPL